MRTWKVLTNDKVKTIMYNGIHIYFDDVKKKEHYLYFYQDGKLVAKLDARNNEIVGALS